MKQIKIELGASSIDKAIAEIERYKEGLNNRLFELVDKLVQSGVEVAKMKVLTSQGDSTDAYVGYMINSVGDIIKAEISVEGSEVLFIEFGAGIYYNNGNAHPYAAEFGYGVGTYPSEHPPNKAINPGYWWYSDENKNKHLSLGTEATMPMFSAAENIRNTVIQTAIDEFMRG